jgi:DnaK suppressor protein
MAAPMDHARQRHFAPSELTGRQLATLRSLLLDALVEHRRQLAQQEEHITLAGNDADERQVTQLAVLRAAEAVADVEHALGRFDDGTYGTCEHCGRPVPFERLEAIPAARNCVRCQVASPFG